MRISACVVCRWCLSLAYSQCTLHSASADERPTNLPTFTGRGDCFDSLRSRTSFETNMCRFCRLVLQRFTNRRRPLVPTRCMLSLDFDLKHWIYCKFPLHFSSHFLSVAQRGDKTLIQYSLSVWDQMRWKCSECWFNLLCYFASLLIPWLLRSLVMLECTGVGYKTLSYSRHCMEIGDLSRSWNNENCNGQSIRSFANSLC